MQLADNDTLSTINDELATTNHDWQIAQINRLIDRCIAFEEAQPNVQWSTIGESKLAAFILVVSLFAEFIANVFKTDCFIVVFDRENFTKNRLQTNVLSFVRRKIRLQKTVVGNGLDFGQIRNRKIVLDPSEIADSLRNNSTG